MSLIEPEIDELLDKADNDRFLLCTMAAKRARDVNDMMCGQRDRAMAHTAVAAEIARKTNRKPLSLAFEEIGSDDVSYDPATIDVE